MNQYKTFGTKNRKIQYHGTNSEEFCFVFQCKKKITEKIKILEKG